MSMPQRAPQATDPKYNSFYDVKAMFDKNPSKLVAYVEMGILKDVSLLGVHIYQLASRVGIVLESGSIQYNNLPEGFVDPRDFDNIGAIVAAGKIKFPDFSSEKVV